MRNETFKNGTKAVRKMKSKKYTKEELLKTTARWTLAAALASLTGFLSSKLLKGGRCADYDRCAKCTDKSNCSLTETVSGSKWKAK